MFEIRPMPAQIDAAILERARLAEPAVIGHFRLRGFPDCRIRPLIPTQRIVGTVVTLTLPAFDSTLLHHAAGMLRPGDVLLIDRLGDRHHACLGGGVALALAKVGVVAAIIDGPAADPAEILEHGMPVWATGISAITTRTYGLAGSMNYPVSIGGAVAMPGDVVIADEGGIVILPPEEALEDIERAIKMAAMEKEMMPQLSPEMPLGKMSGATAMVLQKLKN